MTFDGDSNPSGSNHSTTPYHCCSIWCLFVLIEFFLSLSPTQSLCIRSLTHQRTRYDYERVLKQRPCQQYPLHTFYISFLYLFLCLLFAHTLSFYSWLSVRADTLCVSLSLSLSLILSFSVFYLKIKFLSTTDCLFVPIDCASLSRCFFLSLSSICTFSCLLQMIVYLWLCILSLYNAFSVFYLYAWFLNSTDCLFVPIATSSLTSITFLILSVRVYHHF